VTDWTRIELASKLGLPFDFEGSMQEPIERFVRSFGARPISVPIVSKICSGPFFAKAQIQELKAFCFPKNI